MRSLSLIAGQKAAYTSRQSVFLARQVSVDLIISTHAPVPAEDLRYSTSSGPPDLCGNVRVIEQVNDRLS